MTRRMQRSVIDSNGHGLAGDEEKVIHEDDVWRK